MAAKNVIFLSSLFFPRLAKDSHKYNRNFATALRHSCSSSKSSNTPKEIVEWMGNYCPVFRVRSDAISVLDGPTQFFQRFTVGRHKSLSNIVIIELLLDLCETFSCSPISLHLNDGLPLRLCTWVQVIWKSSW